MSDDLSALEEFAELFETHFDPERSLKRQAHGTRSSRAYRKVHLGGYDRQRIAVHRKRNRPPEKPTLAKSAS